MKIQSKFMTGLVSRIVKKVLRTKLGCEVDIQLNEFRTTVIDTEQDSPHNPCRMRILFHQTESAELWAPAYQEFCRVCS